MMQIRMQESIGETGLSFQPWDLGIVGEAIDDRGEAARSFIKSNSKEVVSARYDSDQFVIEIDGNVRNAEHTAELLRNWSSKRVVFETTTLGFVETFLCAKALKQLHAFSLEMVYVEPKEYLNVPGGRLLEKRHFELSEEVPGFKGIPGATLVTTERTTQRVVFFLGFEERRLDVALESQVIHPSEVAVIFGVPAFTPSWEMHSFANNIRVIQDHGLSGGIHFCGAENPTAAYDKLSTLYEALAPGERLIIGPLGPKPNGIGTALFAAEHSDVGLLYDHPRKSRKRT
jgi:hypothetical protein